MMNDECSTNFYSSMIFMQIFLELDGEKKEGVEFLDTTLTIGKADQVMRMMIDSLLTLHSL